MWLVELPFENPGCGAGVVVMFMPSACFLYLDANFVILLACHYDVE